MRARSYAWTLPALLVLAIAVSGCTSSGPQVAGDYTAKASGGRIRYQINPYQINGVWYYPKADYSYDETGTASWYGQQFHGRPTSDGEIFDMNQVSAAHKTLPLPSVVEVTNLQNGRALRMRVNDRGPFVDGRIIDLSRRAAQLLGYETAGTAQVRVRILKEESIQVADEVLRGKPGRTMVAQASTVVQTPALAARPAEMPVAAPIVVARQQQPASLRAPVVVGATPRVESPPIQVAEALPPPEPMPRAIVAPAPVAPRPRPQVETEPEPIRVAEEAPPPAASPAHRRWPSLISQAHADTLRPSLAPPPPPAQKPVLAVARGSSRIYVQAGAFAVPANAQKMRARIASMGSVEVLPTSAGHGAPLYRVRVGPVSSEAEAARLMNRLADSGFPGARVVGE